MEVTKPFPQWAGDSQYKMINVGDKPITERRAIAQGQIRMSYPAFCAVRDNSNPKGNVLALAEVAGIIAAKKTSELIPLCHPLPLDQVRLSFRLNEKEQGITVLSEVSAKARTGVEMEALSAVNGALLCIYDLCKAVDPVLVISDIRLVLKEGGKSGRWNHPEGSLQSKPLEGIRCAVITISDRAYSGKYEDTSGPALVGYLEELGSEVVPLTVVPDDKEKIQYAVRNAIRNLNVRLVLTTGGTGIGPRDVTPEAVEEICDRVVPGFGECLRSQGAHQTRMSWMSRSLGAVLEGALIIALPGSEKAVKEGIDSLSKLLPHALDVLAGGKHD